MERRWRRRWRRFSAPMEISATIIWIRSRWKATRKPARRIAAGARDDREPGGRGAAAAGGIVAGGGGQRGGPGDVRQPDRLELCAARQRRSSDLAAGRGSGGRDGRQFDFAGHASAAATSVLPGQRLAGGLTSIHWNHRREGAETKNLPAMRGANLPAAESGACWCGKFPALAGPRAGSDCLCPECLEQAVEKERTGAGQTSSMAGAARREARTAQRAVPTKGNEKSCPASESLTAQGGRKRAARKRAGGFTLIELLVTIAVMGILASIFLPALSRGKLPAQTAKCGSNLRQFVAAAQMYWDDNAGNTFAYAGPTTTSGTYYWFGLLGNGPEETRTFDPTAGPFYPWLGTGVDFCPAFDYCSSQFKLKAARADVRLRLQFLHLRAAVEHDATGRSRQSGLSGGLGPGQHL